MGGKKVKSPVLNIFPCRAACDGRVLLSRVAEYFQ